MDVTFTDVLEGARQYFQGLPTGTSSTVGPSYSTDAHRRIDHEQNQEMPPSSNSYWPSQPTESVRPPAREHTPVQRPSSHSSDSSRPPSHSQYNPNVDQSRILYSGSYQEQYTTAQQQQQQHSQQQQPPQQQHHQHQQSFQFPRPQSREAPSNHPQYQSHVPTSSPYYQIPSPYHHQASSPQLPRAPSREQMVPRVPSREQSIPRVPSREQLIARTPSREQINTQIQYPQTSENFNYSQSHSYYPMQSQAKSMPSNNTYKTTISSHSYPTASEQQNVYYKQIYSTQSQMSHQNVYSNTKPNITHLSEINHQHQQQNSQSATVSNDSTEQGGIRTTHNLPPIAAISNYHSSRTVREPTRPAVTNCRTRPFSTSSYVTNTSQQNTAVTSNSSIIQQTPTRSLPNTSSTPVSNYHQSYRTYTTQPQQHHGQYQYPVTVTTQNYTHVIMTTSNSTSSYYPPSNRTTQSSSQQLNYQPMKSNPQNVPRNQASAAASMSQQHQQSTVDTNLNGKSIIKRESPLDLSVKTVRTPADSTLGDTENEARNKYYLTNRTAHSSISTHNYPQVDVNSFQKTFTQRSSVPVPSATAPKVEFRPNFNVPSLNQPPKQLKRSAEVSKRSVISEKAHSSGRSMYNNKNISYPPSNINRYPTVSIPSAAHVNSYIQAQEVIPTKSQVSNNRLDFSTPNHKTNSIYAVPSHDPQKKRPADVAPLIVPNKVAKLDSWRESIDMQIEERLSSCKQHHQHSKFAVATSKSTVINGSYTAIGQEKSKDIYSMYQKPSYENMTQHVSHNQAQSHYHIQSNHSQTYVPSPATHQYPGYAGVTSQQSQAPNTPNLNTTSRSNSNPSLASVGQNTKNSLGGAVDKRVLSLLRNSLEIKGQKKVFEQLKSHEQYTHHPRSDIQHPSTDVTAPLQPKPGLIGRNNVSPFTPTSFPDNSNTPLIYNKFHIPKAIDSINFEINKNQNPLIDKHILDTVITNHTTPNSDYDGLAAFLAARIRTKGELKQGGPNNQNISNNNSSITESRLQGIIENQLKSPMKQDTLQSSLYCASSGTTTSSSPPKLSKERQAPFAPRKRLFSRNEEDPCNNSVPPRDKSGLRSSSETSVFDFPDSDSETDMNGRESLEAMRKGRKSSLKHTAPINTAEIKVESPGPTSPGDDMFAKLCDNFVEQLKSGAGKRKVKRKKPLEPEVLAKLESFAKEKPLEIKQEVAEIKQESKETDNVGKGTPEVLVTVKIKEESDIPSSTDSKTMSTPESELKRQTESDSKSNSDSTIKKEDPVFINNKENVRRRLVSSSDSSDSETETTQNDTQSGNKVDNEISNLTKISEERKEGSEEKKESESPQKSKEIVPIIRPAKKPSFGDGSDFYPGWEEGVYKYKKSLRMPPTLIQVSRPPQFHRLSTSLPDLDPCPQSPSASIIADTEKEGSKTKLKKIKSEPLDSDNESNSSLNLFIKKTNYDSEGSASIRSLPNTAKEMSILDRLLEKCGGRRKRKMKRKEDHSPKVVQKSENSVELLPTPGLEMKKESGKEVKKLAAPVVKSDSAFLGFRKTTINTFKDAFIKNANNIVGVNEQFTTVVLKSRTRKETRVLKQRATIKEVFGEDRPASAPPVTCVNDIQIKEEITESEENSCLANLIVKLEKQNDIEQKGDVEPSSKVDKENEAADTKLMLKSKLLNKGKKKEKLSLLKNIADKKIKMEVQDEIEDETRSLDEIIIKRDPDEKSETPSVDGDDVSVSGRRRGKFGKMRRKLSSGFDYIRKKKKIKKEVVESDCGEKKKRKPVLSKTLESVDDIQKEIKTWVLNKGIGETHLHRSARLGYTDVTAYCLEKMECQPSPKDNAGYTPLHEACSRGHLQIAKLLLLYGANASESAQGGIRPLHEAVENGFVEIARLLLSYGADPTLATYSGLTPLALTNDEITKEFLKNHLNDIEGEPSPPWICYGPASFFDPIDDIGYNILDDVPDADPEPEDEDIEFEISDNPLPVEYILRGESANDRWILLQDLSNLLKIKSRDALLRQICPPSTSSANVNYRSVLRELKTSDFLVQAHCCQFLNAGEKINSRASKIALVKCTDKVKELLNIEKVAISSR